MTFHHLKKKTRTTTLTEESTTTASHFSLRPFLSWDNAQLALPATFTLMEYRQSTSYFYQRSPYTPHTVNVAPPLILDYLRSFVFGIYFYFYPDLFIYPSFRVRRHQCRAPRRVTATRNPVAVTIYYTSFRKKYTRLSRHDLFFLLSEFRQPFVTLIAGTDLRAISSIRYNCYHLPKTEKLT